MKIKKCKKMSSGKYRVYFDNGKEMIIYEDVLVNENLLAKEIDAELLSKINSLNDYADIYSKSIKYIASRLRSEKEMIEYLKNKNIMDSQIPIIIDKLKATGLINDYQFAVSYINDKLNLTNQGFGKMKNYLLQNNIDEEIIDKIIANVDVDYDERIKKIIKKQISLNKNKSKLVLRNKIYNNLLSMGYESSDILRNLDVNTASEDESLASEYQKLFTKLSKKYKDKELSNTMKRKLYQKGFDYSQVDNFIASKSEE